MCLLSGRQRRPKLFTDQCLSIKWARIYFITQSDLGREHLSSFAQTLARTCQVQLESIESLQRQRKLLFVNKRKFKNATFSQPVAARRVRGPFLTLP
jgi:hypothetical protein